MLLIFRKMSRHYIIVEFDEGITPVPSNWLNSSNTSAYWPPFKNQIKINSAMSRMDPPGDDWDVCEVKRIFGASGLFSMYIILHIPYHLCTIYIIKYVFYFIP